MKIITVKIEDLDFGKEFIEIHKGEPISDCVVGLYNLIYIWAEANNFTILGINTYLNSPHGSSSFVITYKTQVGGV